MASQITHIPYARKIKNLFLSDQLIEDNKYYLGTLFPDIRYLGNLKREETHDLEPTIDKLVQMRGSFNKGSYVHSLVDVEREKTLKKLGIYNYVEENGINVSVIKFVEDEFSYGLIHDWSKYVKYLDEIVTDETTLVSVDIVKKWHILLKKYFSEPPTIQTIVAFSQNLHNFDADTIERAKNAYQKIKSNRKALSIIQETYIRIFN